MAYTFKELKKKTVADLREIAKATDHEAVKGYTQLNKEHLLVALCQALDIDTFEHHRAAADNKSEIKAKIKELKKKRDEFIAEHNRKELKMVRRRIHRLKRELRKTMV